MDRKLTTRHLDGDRNWPFRIAELHADSRLEEHAAKPRPCCKRGLRSPTTRYLAVVRALTAPGQQTSSWREVPRKSPLYPWNAELIELISELPAERTASQLRRLWERGGLEEAILAVLARRPRLEDGAKFGGGIAVAELATNSAPPGRPGQGLSSEVKRTKR